MSSIFELYVVGSYANKNYSTRVCVDQVKVKWSSDIASEHIYYIAVWNLKRAKSSSWNRSVRKFASKKCVTCKFFLNKMQAQKL